MCEDADVSSASGPQSPDDPRLTPDDARLRHLHPFTRRQVLGGMAGAAAAMAGLTRATDAAGLLPITPATLLAQASAGTPPADAAPDADQVFVIASDPTTVRNIDFYEQVYQRPSASDLFSDSLVRMDRNFQIIPAAATSWSGNPDNTVWTFELDPGLVWSDGNPVTANDWVKTLQYGADPKHAWDFTWFFQDVIKNWNEAVAGTVTPDQIGVHEGANANQLVIETVAPAPYIPSMMLYSPPLSAAALEKTGSGLYNADPATAVSSGPFILAEFSRDQRVVYKRNDSYKGQLKVPISTVIIQLAAPNTWFTLYQGGQIDYMEGPAPQELKLAEADPQMSQEIYQGVGDFRTFYLFFDTAQAPFTDIRVRQAFSHAVDRDGIQQALLTRQGIPAYSMLAPGFPAANGEALKGIQNYDPNMAKDLLKQAGFDGGKGFPKQTMIMRTENPLNQNVAQAIAAGLSDTLGIQVEVSIVDNATFNAQRKTYPFGYVSYGMDYLDPSNMLGIWASTGVMNWKNPDFDAAYNAAKIFTGDPAQRIAMFQDVEKTLVTQVPGVFVYHVTPIQLAKSYLKGAFLEADQNGLKNMHWPGYVAFDTVPSELYMGQGVPSGRA